MTVDNKGAQLKTGTQRWTRGNVDVRTVWSATIYLLNWRRQRVSCSSQSGRRRHGGVVAAAALPRGDVRGRHVAYTAHQPATPVNTDTT